jgi:hypothetical protein
LPGLLVLVVFDEAGGGAPGAASGGRVATACPDREGAVGEQDELVDELGVLVDV